jgi:uncharacterized protein (DUF488 family)
MNSNPLFTIGHSNRELPEFVELLEEHGITAVADVRSQPYSGRHPDFNAEPLKMRLRQSHVQYVFLGDELGARRIEPECYVGGKARYELVAKLVAFRNGLDRIREGAREHRIAMMCAEKDPLTCHRGILICRHLRDEMEIRHLLSHAETETHEQAESRLLDIVGLPSRDLFQTREELLVEAYRMQGEKIAYQETEIESARRE